MQRVYTGKFGEGGAGGANKIKYFAINSYLEEVVEMNAAIFGAGNAGKFLYDEILKSSTEIKIEGFIDNYLAWEYRGKKIYCPEEFFRAFGEIDAVFIAAGAQKTLKKMIDNCLSYHVDQIYMMHDIAGKCKLPLFDDNGMIKTRIRKLKFSAQKPSLAYFEVPVTDDCNLNCKGCLFASNLTQGTELHNVCYTELEQDAKRMSELFYDVPWIRILGGEPLMHPDIIKILKSYRKYFPDSEIDLCTNGLLIPKMDEAFWKTIKQERISIHISGYKPVYKLLDKIDSILKEKDIPYVILKRDEFLKYYTEKANNDMEKSFEKCIASGCYEVYKGKLSTCSAVIAFEKFNKIFGTSYQITENEDWFDIHNSQIDAWEVKKKLEEPSYICKYCSDSKLESFKWDYSSQIPSLDDYLVSED